MGAKPGTGAPFFPARGCHVLMASGPLGIPHFMNLAGGSIVGHGDRETMPPLEEEGPAAALVLEAAAVCVERFLIEWRSILTWRIGAAIIFLN